MNQGITNKLSLKNKLAYSLKRYKGINIETDLSEYNQIIEKIQLYNFRLITDPELILIHRSLKKQAEQGTDLDSLLPEAYALVSEVCSRQLGMTPFAVQMAAGIAMHQAKLVQMKTGEGKTLAAVFPVYLNALTGKGVYVMTANDYLAKRDALWMGKVYGFLELDAVFIQEISSGEERRKAYQADITYLTAKQGGFDFLKDQLQYSKDKLLQREYNLVIVDEADFIMIDEARIPMVIAAESPGLEIDPFIIDKLFYRLNKDIDYRVDRIGRNSFLTEKGQALVEEILGCGGIHEEDSFQIFAAVNVALHAHTLLTKDIDYIVRAGEIELIDEFTGRVADQRRMPYGIQTALEAKEGLVLKSEGRICGSITVQNFINLFPKIAAMTATAEPAADEFKNFYNLTTVIIPPHKPERMTYGDDRIFVSIKAKERALVNEIIDVHKSGRPVLVGTGTIKESENLAELLRGRGIKCNVLNAKNDEMESGLIAQAGMLGGLTISTNMAGRGTDIKLGGDDGQDVETILTLSGLYVIGTNRHESRRIDNQLRGRAGRQGDPGFSRFFISLEDELIQRYGILEFIPEKFINSDSSEPITDRKVIREIVRAQSIIEDQHFTMKRTLREYSALVENQRKYLHIMRMNALVYNHLPDDLYENLKCRINRIEDSSRREQLIELVSKILLLHLDNFWSEHLAFIDYLREGIHLHRYGGKNPLLVYIEKVSNGFEMGMACVKENTSRDMEKIEMTESGYHLDLKGLKGPSSTWTYLINDNPFPNFNISMISGSNIGFATAYAVQAGLLMIFDTLMRAIKRKKTD